MTQSGKMQLEGRFTPAYSRYTQLMINNTRKRDNAALERLAHATHQRSPLMASPLQALVSYCEYNDYERKPLNFRTGAKRPYSRIVATTVQIIK